MRTRLRLSYIVCLLVMVITPVLNVYGQITTMFYGKDKIQSNGYTGALYSVKIYSNSTHVTVELIPTKNLSRMNYWSSVNTVIEIDNGVIKLPIKGFLRTVNGKEVISTEPFSGNWGWSKVKAGEKYHYTMVFDGRIPPGCTKISIMDNGIPQLNSFTGVWYNAHGYGFSNCTITNPPVGGTSWTEQSVKRYADENNDGICGIYETSNGNGYKLACIKQDGKYILIYLDSKVKMSWWKVGDKKATLRQSATAGFFKADWIMADKSVNSDYYIAFDGGSMKAVVHSSEDFYIKMYPTATSSASSSYSENWSGSGFALNNAYVCTNYHVIDGAKTIKVYGIDGNFSTGYYANVVATDKINDLAILKVPHFSSFGTIPYSVKTTMDEVGEEIFVLGYPLTTTMGDEVKLTTGVISSKTGFQGGVSLYQISAPVQPGNSGGPLFDSKGNLVGIISAKHAGAENVSYAVKASYLKNLMDSSLSADILPKNNALSSLPLTGKVSRLKNFVYYIECSSRSSTLSNSSSSYIPHNNSGNSGLNVYVDVENPQVVSTRKGMGITIKRVRITDTQTIVDMECDRVTSKFINVAINPKTVIQCGGETYSLIDAKGIPLVPKYYYFHERNEKLSFTLYFQAIPKSASVFDIIEPEGREEPWKFYGIKLK